MVKKAIVKKQRKSFTSLVKSSSSLKSTWDDKMKLKAERKLLKQIDDDKRKAIKEAKEEKRKRREENLRRREENAKKSEVVQLVKNPAKLKRMKKKQLKRLRKVD